MSYKKIRPDTMNELTMNVFMLVSTTPTLEKILTTVRKTRWNSNTKRTAK